MRLLFAALACAVGFSTSAAAVPLQIFESSAIASGDFDGATQQSNANIGTLGLGTNVIIGTFDGSCISFFGDIDCGASARGDRQDSFKLTVPIGLEIVGFAGQFEGTGPNDFKLAYTISELTPFPFPDLAVGLAPINALTDIPLSPIGAGEYFFSVNTSEGTTLSDFNVSWSMLIEVGPVSQVPLPAGLPMLLAGLGIFGVLRRRKPA
ncbi:MAG: VPLPA-CTERM sorting domain-containing protein [Pseudomonadota bacterium]